MASITTRSGKGSELSWAEMDANLTAINTELGGKALAAHAHGVADLTATGTKSATTFLRGDNTWAVPASGAAGPLQQVVTTTALPLTVSHLGATIILGPGGTITWNATTLGDGFWVKIINDTGADWTVPTPTGGTLRRPRAPGT